MTSTATELTVRPRWRDRASRWWQGRAGAALLTEVGFLYALFTFYKVVRYFARDRVGAAVDNAHAVLSIERAVGIATELKLQRIALHSVGFVVLCNRYYVTMHFLAMTVFLIVVYARHAELYRHVRRVLIGSTSVALVAHVVFPLAPPRMFPGLGFMDTMARFGPNCYASGRIASMANQFAAMPSVHFAWSLLVAYGVIRLTAARLRWLVLVHPTTTLTAIIVTANHYWADALVAAAICGLTIAAARHLEGTASRRLPPSPGVGTARTLTQRPAG